MKAGMTFRDYFYLAASALWVLLGIVMLLRLKFDRSLILAWVVALGFMGVGAYRLWIAWKALKRQ